MTVLFGENLKIELYGTSHGPCIGVRIEGLPEGKTIDTERLQEFLNRRAPGRNAWSTPRKEADRPVFLSGVREMVQDGILVTTGEVMTAEIRNTNTRPQDYKESTLVPRPGHADYPAWVKYGKIESGGGQFSARLTAALCIAGGIFLQWLKEEGIEIAAHIAGIGGIEDTPFDPLAAGPPEVGAELPVIDSGKGDLMKDLISSVKADGDSIGGSIECMITGMPAGAGEPLFGSIEGRICQSIFTVPAVKGIEFGAGFDVCRMRGSENNDPFTVLPQAQKQEQEQEQTSDQSAGSQVRTTTNHHGGILGGLASGMPILFRVAMKPTPSIARAQKSVDLSAMTPAQLQIKGRHDPCIVPRAVPCIEAAAAVAVMDLLLGERG